MTRNHLMIEAGKAEQRYWADLWHYRELFYFLSWRDLLVRYKQTVIGVLWAVLRPVLTTTVFVFIFGRLAKMPSGGIPYPVLVFSAMLPWQLFSSALTEASSSLITNANMIAKVYFPRLIVPASAVIVAFGDFLISCGILGILMLVYRIVPSWHLFLLIPLTGIVLLASLGAGIWFAALNVEYRDFRYVVPFVVQFGLYVSPVGFSSNIVPENLRLLYSLNPMVGAIDGFRWAITGDQSTIYWPGFALSLSLVIIMSLTGLWYFRKTERAFADVI